MQLTLYIILCLALAFLILASILISRRQAHWCKCAWHGSEFWYSNMGHTQTFQPWHIEDKDISHGCCKSCYREMLKGLNEP